MKLVLNILLLPFRILLGLLRLLWVSPLFWLAMRSRPFWRWCLRTATALKIKNVAGLPTCLCIEFERQSAWQEVVVLVDELKFPQQRMRMASAFAMLYLRLQRWEEAREAVRHWNCLPEHWVQQHPQEAAEALKLHRSLSLWYPFGVPNLAPVNVIQPNSIQAITVWKRAFVLDQGMMDNWRDSRLVGEIVEWIVKHIANEGAQIPVLREPVRSFNSVNGVRILAVQFGIGPSTIRQMWLRATKLEP